jgi:hypothetical protein
LGPKADGTQDRQLRGEGCEGLAIQNHSGLPQGRADHSVLG